MTENESRVFIALKSGAKSWEDLINSAHLTIKEIRQALTGLESKGYIESEIKIKILK